MVVMTMCAVIVIMFVRVFMTMLVKVLMAVHNVAMVMLV